MNEICHELGQNFLEYSYETNSNRAFPDVRDGLKPSQRAILWELWTRGYFEDKPHVKSAKVVGSVIGLWSPHGDVSTYETAVHMSQDWTNNVPFISWHGNNGNKIIGDFPANQRYTEMRLAKVAEEGLFSGIKKNNVPMIPNFSEDEVWPEVLPAVLPSLLLNGCQGIGVTIASTWVPYSLKDCCEVIQSYLSTGELNYSGFYPDFPSGGMVVNKDELLDIPATGKGRIVLRGKSGIDGNTIRITELPYQVYAEQFLEEVRGLIADGTLNSVNKIYNKSAGDDLVLEIECDYSPRVVLQKLYDCTDLQKVINVNQVGLIGKTPTLLNLQQYLDLYIEHNVSCVKREYEFDRQKATERLEIVDGLLAALSRIDEVITIIRNAKSSSTAVSALKKELHLSDAQAKAVVDMRLGRLAGLERKELENEKRSLEQTLKTCIEVIGSEAKQKAIFAKRLKELAAKYANSERKTEITQRSMKDDTHVKETVYLESTPFGVRRVQNASAFSCHEGDKIAFFAESGKIIYYSVDNIPNSAKGIKYENVSKNEKIITSEVACAETGSKICVVRQDGNIKLTNIERTENAKRLPVSVGDDIAYAFPAKTDDTVIILTSKGRALCFEAEEIPYLSCSARGAKGIGLDGDDDSIAWAGVVSEETIRLSISDGEEMVFTPNACDKQHRAGKGKRICKSGLRVNVM